MMAVLPVLMAVILLLLFVFYLQFRWRFRHILSAASRLPRPPAFPLIGNVFFFFGGIEKLTKRIITFTTQFNGRFCIWIGPVPVFVVSDPTDVQIILNSSNMLEKDDVYKFLTPFLGNGLLTAPVHVWKKYRRLISPVLHPSNVERFLPVFNDLSRQLVEAVAEREPVQDPRHAIFETAMDTVMRTVMAREEILDVQTKADAIVLFDMVGQMFIDRLFKFWLHLDWLFNWLYKKEIRQISQRFDACVKVFDQYMLEAETNPKFDCYRNTQPGFESSPVRSMLELSLTLPDEEDHLWRDDVCTMLVGATDTVVSAISFLLLTLANHPSIQDKVEAEIQELVGDSDRELTLQDLNSLSYMGQAIMEGMRLHGTFPVILRKATRDTKLSTITLPAGSRVMLTLHAMGWDPELFPEPHRFQPERFSPENVQDRHHYAFLPFSGGPRNCPGKMYAMLLMKTVLVHLLRRYRVRSKLRLEDVEYELKVVMFSKTPVMLEFVPR